MMRYHFAVLAGAVFAAALSLGPAQALTQKECSAKYQAAKEDGKLGSTTWNDFRQTQCAEPDPAITAAVPAKPSTPKGAKPKVAAMVPQAPGGLSMKDCSARYQASKEAGTLGGLKWNDFRKAVCGAGSSDDDSVPALSEAAFTVEPEAPAIAAPRGVKFPRSISRKFSGGNAEPGADAHLP